MYHFVGPILHRLRSSGLSSVLLNVLPLAAALGAVALSAWRAVFAFSGHSLGSLDGGGLLVLVIIEVGKATGRSSRDGTGLSCRDVKGRELHQESENGRGDSLLVDCEVEPKQKQSETSEQDQIDIGQHTHDQLDGARVDSQGTVEAQSGWNLVHRT
jgi:hypothetical protein